LRKPPSNLEKRALLFILLVVFSSASIAYSQNLKSEKEEVEERLDQLRRELADKRESVEKLEETEKGVLEKLMDLQERIDLSQELLSRIRQRAKQLSGEIDSLVVTLKITSDSLQSKREDLKLRLLNIYKQSRWHRYQLLMDADSFLQLGRRLYLLERLAAYDSRRIREVETLRKTQEERERLLKEDRGKLEALAQESEREGALLAVEQKRESKQIEQVRRRRKLALEAVEQLEASVEQMGALIAQLEEKIQAEQGRAAEQGRLQPAEDFVKLKGRLLWPVKGEILIPYGIVTHPVFKTQTTNHGVDIKAPLGTVVKATAAGRVVYQSWMRGYGNFVIISHPEGLTSLYGHLLEAIVGVDQWVVAGQVIARVGESGTFLGPCLHFELRHGRKSLNPEEWLR
jgi:septal ring factor EnvC (AmiA/AmiB activator)